MVEARRVCAAILFIVLMTGFCLTSASATSQTWGAAVGEVIVVVGNDFSYEVPLLQVRRLLEHQGLIYHVTRDSEISDESLSDCILIIVIGATGPIISALQQNTLISIVKRGTGLIWIGQDLPDSLYSFFGITPASVDENLNSATKIIYGEVFTRIFNETIYKVETLDATVAGFFTDDKNLKISPAETCHRWNNESGVTYYFAYDVYSWWGADSETPWMRAYRLQLAVESVINEHVMVRLSAFPRNLKSVFLCRIEDVDPYHNGEEWLARAHDYLSYYAYRKIPLSVSLTPNYLDPSIGLSIGLEAKSAEALREWLMDVVVRGGAIIQHGFTHQYNMFKTGIAPEFFNNETSEWLTLDEQKERIAQGLEQIYSSIGNLVYGFETPHYIANNDTYTALNILGFTYVTESSDTPYFDQYGLAQGLINIPETLGYIPVNSSSTIGSIFIYNMDMLYDMGGVQLFFNHLFDDEAGKIGKDLLNHTLTKPSNWYTSTNGLADFWHERLRAYNNMSIDTAKNSLKITLGPSNKAGLTLITNTRVEIEGASVNGNPCPLFGANYVILPTLPESPNSITITFSNAEWNSNSPFGWSMIMISIALSTLFYRRTRLSKRTYKPLDDQNA